MNEKENVKSVFAKNSNAYVTSSTHSKGSDLPLLVKWLQPEPSMIALDIATGGGHVAKHLSKHVAKVIASDLTKEMLDNTANHLSSYENIMYKIADAEELPFENNTFDIVACRIAAHHFPSPEKFISEVYRVLKPNGKFIFIDNIAPEDSRFDEFVNTLEKMRDYSHVRSHSILEWKELFTKYQLTVMKEQVRKKTLPYQEWIDRTLDSDEAKNKVGSYIVEASSKVHDYFQVDINQGEIQSFTIDEWMVMCEK
ncbi:class I SAM-dependent methyltransferase [Virgibacillus necropolis]|uniref:SAM-dependent methyltransferase n=1 Tax=Virgibacillus necropolis TaxID=163877 RepID=A0A221MDT4_9BACI|nr:class I SAM-dependent methyltransferase [Virgibacillus necropolis]ASN05826.1 SAM-dependent methyltransferase [Virgibacillus necropolis]